MLPALVHGTERHHPAMAETAPSQVNRLDIGVHGAEVQFGAPRAGEFPETFRALAGGVEGGFGMIRAEELVPVLLLLVPV